MQQERASGSIPGWRCNAFRRLAGCAVFGAMPDTTLLGGFTTEVSSLSHVVQCQVTLSCAGGRLMGRFMLGALLALTFGAAACERPAPSDRPTRDTAPETATGVAADPAMEQTTECVNRIEGYMVEYPATWHVNTGEILGPCSLFDPDPIEVPRDSEIPLEIAITIDFEPVPFATLTGEVLGRRDLSREQTTVDGREAMRIECESTGEGLHDPGIRSYQYFVDLGDTTMIATTYGAGSLPLERKRRILDAMMARLDFRQPEHPDQAGPDRRDPQ